MSSESLGSSSRSIRSVPAAIWVALAVLAVAAAGLGGALVMHTRDQAAAPQHAAASLPPPTAETSVAGAGPAQPTGVAGSFVAQPSAKQPPLQAPAQPPMQSSLQPEQQPVQVAQLAPIAPAPPQPVPPPARPTQAATQVAQAPHPAPRVPVCATCGTVTSVHAVREKGNGTGIGVAGGAVTGGLLGHQVGGGSGKTALTVLGALGGAFAGNEVEKRVRATTVYDVQVRMDDGSVRTLRRSAPIAEGTQVRVEGNTLRIAQRPAHTRPRDLAQGG